MFLCVFVLGACAPQATPSPTIAPTQTASSTPAPSATATHPSTATQTPIPISAICSPLADHDLAILMNYMSQPLIPPLGANKEMGHHGVDFAYYRRDGVGGHIQGTPVQSVLDGVVAGIGYTTVYGNYLIVETRRLNLPVAVVGLYDLKLDQSLYLLYAHMQNPFEFALGQALACGAQIGEVGDSGDPFYSSDPHLHLETRSGPSGIQLAPMDYYNTQASEEEKAEWEFWRSSDTFTLLDPVLLLEASP